MNQKLTRFDYVLISIIIFMAAAILIATKWSDYGSLTSGNIADSDTFMVLDTSDTSLGGTGTQKQYSWSALKTDLSNFDNFGFPYGANPTVDEAAEAAVDTSDNQLLFYGTALNVLTGKHRQCFTLEDPADTDDNVPIFSLDDGFTVTDMRCWTEGGTNVVMYLSDGTNNLDSMTCDSDGADDDGSISNATFSADEQMEFDITSTTGAVDWVNFCFSYTITRE